MRTRRTGNEGIHDRVDQGARYKEEHNRAVRKAHLLKELEGTTHWEGCESCHPWCAELLDIARADRNSIVVTEDDGELQ